MACRDDHSDTPGPRVGEREAVDDAISFGHEDINVRNRRLASEMDVLQATQAD